MIAIKSTAGFPQNIAMKPDIWVQHCENFCHCLALRFAGGSSLKMWPLEPSAAFEILTPSLQSLVLHNCWPRANKRSRRLRPPQQISFKQYCNYLNSELESVTFHGRAQRTGGRVVDLHHGLRTVPWGRSLSIRMMASPSE